MDSGCYKKCTEELIDVLSKMDLFSGISHSDIAFFVQDSSVLSLSRNDTLFLHDEEATHFYLIIDGWVKLYRDSQEGVEAVLDIVNSGSFLGEISAGKKQRTLYNAQLVSRSGVVLAIPLQTIQQKIEHNGKLGYRIVTALTEQNNQLRGQIEKLTVMSAEQRVVSYLMKLKKQNKSDLDLPYSKALAATHLGMKPETFSRVLRQLQKYGIRIKGGNVSFANDLYQRTDPVTAEKSAHYDRVANQ